MNNQPQENLLQEYEEQDLLGEDTQRAGWVGTCTCLACSSCCGTSFCIDSGMCENC